METGNLMTKITSRSSFTIKIIVISPFITEGLVSISVEDNVNQHLGRVYKDTSKV